MKTTAKHLIPNAGSLILIALLLLTQAAGAGLAAEPAGSQTPSQTLISYQGSLTDPNGNPISADLPMVFALYNAESGGTLKWGPETQTVKITNGQFAVLLGQNPTITPANLTGDLYLDITVNGEELAPRERLASVPYAVQAGSLSQLDIWYRTLTVTDGNGEPIPSGWIGMTDWLGDGKQWLHLGGITGSDGVRRVGYFANNHFFTGNVGIGVREPGAQLHVADNVAAGGNMAAGGNITVGGSLAVNGSGFFGGATYSEGAMNLQSIAVPLTFKESDTSGQGSLWRMPLDTGKLRFDVSDNGTDFASFHTAMTFNANGSVTCGALTEANLQTPEELAAGRIDRFEEGDVLCWAGEQLEKCSRANDRLVQAVADSNGLPIVIGAERVKALGPIQYGDLLVASNVPGYAMVNNEARVGMVIAQALEDFDGKQGIIKAMIRKF